MDNGKRTRRNGLRSGILEALEANSRAGDVSGNDKGYDSLRTGDEINFDSNTLMKYSDMARGLQYEVGQVTNICHGDLKKLKKVVDRSYKLLGGSFPERMLWRFFPSNQKSIDRCIEEASRDIKAQAELMGQYQSDFQKSKQAYFGTKNDIINMKFEIEQCQSDVIHLEERIVKNLADIDQAKKSDSKKDRLYAVDMERKNMSLIEEADQKKKQAYVASQSIQAKCKQLGWHFSTMTQRHKLYSLTEDYVAQGTLIIEHARCLAEQQIDAFQFDKSRRNILQRLKDLSISCNNYQTTLVQQHDYLNETVKGDGHFLRSLITGKPMNGVQQEPKNYQSSIDLAKKIADNL